MSYLLRLTRNFIASLFRVLCGTSTFFQAADSQLSQAVQAQRIYYANHSSHLDFILLWSVLPNEVRQQTRPVAAADYWLSSALKRFLAVKVFQAVLIDRKSGTPEKAMEIMLTALDHGSSLIIFPEGTRSPKGELQPFKSGLYYLHQARPNIPLVPVYLENLNRILPKGEFIVVPLLSTVTIGSELSGLASLDKSAFLEATTNALISLKATK